MTKKTEGAAKKESAGWRCGRSPVDRACLGPESAAPLLVACGEPGHRWASENCEFLLHSASDEVGGSTDQLAAQVKAIQARSKRMDNLLADYTKKPYSHWKRLSEKRVDTIFDADKALEWGLIDNIWSEK